jgi:hypothetical protein
VPSSSNNSNPFGPILASANKPSSAVPLAKAVPPAQPLIAGSPLYSKPQQQAAGAGAVVAPLAAVPGPVIPKPVSAAPAAPLKPPQPSNPAVAAALAAFRPATPQSNNSNNKAAAPSAAAPAAGIGVGIGASAVDYMARLRAQAAEKAKQRYEMECRARDMLIEQEKERVRLKMIANAKANAEKEKAQKEAAAVAAAGRPAARPSANNLQPSPALIAAAGMQQAQRVAMLQQQQQQVQQQQQRMQAAQQQQKEAVDAAKAKKIKEEEARNKILREMELKKQKALEVEKVALAKRKEQAEVESRRAAEALQKVRDQALERKRAEQQEEKERRQMAADQQQQQQRKKEQQVSEKGDQQVALTRAQKEEIAEKNKADIQAMWEKMKQDQVKSSHVPASKLAQVQAAELRAPVRRSSASAAELTPVNFMGGGGATPVGSIQQAAAGARVTPPPSTKERDPNAGGGVIFIPAASPPPRVKAPVQQQSSPMMVGPVHNPAARIATPRDASHAVAGSGSGGGSASKAVAAPSPPGGGGLNLLRTPSPVISAASSPSAVTSTSPSHNHIDIQLEKAEQDFARAQQALEQMKAEKLRHEQQKNRRHSLDSAQATTPDDEDCSVVSQYSVKSSASVAAVYRPPAAGAVKGDRPSSLGGLGVADVSAEEGSHSRQNQQLSAYKQQQQNRLCAAANTKWLSNLSSQMNNLKGQLKDIQLEGNNNKRIGASPSINSDVSLHHQHLHQAVAASRAAPVILSPLDYLHQGPRKSFFETPPLCSNGSGGSAKSSNSKEGFDVGNCGDPQRPSQREGLRAFLQAQRQAMVSFSPVIFSVRSD